MTFKKTFIIGEIGINHNGNLKNALDLIRIAKIQVLMQLNFKKNS